MLAPSQVAMVMTERRVSESIKRNPVSSRDAVFQEELTRFPSQQNQTCWGFRVPQGLRKKGLLFGPKDLLSPQGLCCYQRARMRGSQPLILTLKPVFMSNDTEGYYNIASLSACKQVLPIRTHTDDTHQHLPVSGQICKQGRFALLRSRRFSPTQVANQVGCEYRTAVNFSHRLAGEIMFISPQTYHLTFNCILGMCQRCGYIG